MHKPDFAGTILIGGCAGALLVSVAIHLLYTGAYPYAIHDGQYGMIFMATAPLGWLIGSVVGAAVAWRPDIRRAWLTAGLLIVGGVVVGPFMGLAGVIAVGLGWLLLHPHG